MNLTREITSRCRRYATTHAQLCACLVWRLQKYIYLIKVPSFLFVSRYCWKMYQQRPTLYDLSHRLTSAEFFLNTTVMWWITSILSVKMKSLLHIGDCVLIPTPMQAGQILQQWMSHRISEARLVKLSTAVHTRPLHSSLPSYLHGCSYAFAGAEMHAGWLVLGCLAAQNHTAQTDISILLCTHNSQTNQCASHCCPPLTLERDVCIPPACVTVKVWAGQLYMTCNRTISGFK